MIVLLQLLVDFGLVVLILMVQLTIYPSFKMFAPKDLVQWHKRYTGQIAIIVAPLMMFQVVLASYFVIEDFSLENCISLAFALAAWIATFLLFVPIHKKISLNSHTERDLDNLTLINWLRVGIWIILFLWDFYNYWI